MKCSLVVTSIASPNEMLRKLAIECVKNRCKFILIGDVKSPKNFSLKDCQFYSIEKQNELGLSFAEKCPTNKYSRKNIGYLLAIQNSSDIIVETDDDNLPYENFLFSIQQRHEAKLMKHSGWVNIYNYFTNDNIWPRGFPLEYVRNYCDFDILLDEEKVDCPIQQRLVDGDPDVDSIYRMIFSYPCYFIKGKFISIGVGTWCPFNSQNTVWFKSVFELMYLPSYCSSRMTDIWRSFIAQRILWENNMQVLFTSPTMNQIRNEHILLNDFQDEIEGFLNNVKICEKLEGLSLRKGFENIKENMYLCYDEFIGMKLINSKEFPLLDAWFDDLLFSSV